MDPNAPVWCHVVMRKRGSHVTRQDIATSSAIAAIFVIGVVLSAQSRSRATPTAANGIGMAEFSGYESWQLIATSQAGTDGCGTSKVGCTKAIVGNPAMINAYRAGFPANGKPVPEGARIVKIEWMKDQNPNSPYEVTVPGQLNEVAVMVKDSKRFASTNGWGYATFQPDGTTGGLKNKPGQTDHAFHATLCQQCHTTGAKTTDFVYTAFAKR
jgi:hypothetical protein